MIQGSDKQTRLSLFIQMRRILPFSSSDLHHVPELDVLGPVIDKKAVSIWCGCSFEFTVSKLFCRPISVSCPLFLTHRCRFTANCHSGVGTIRSTPFTTPFNRMFFETTASGSQELLT